MFTASLVQLRLKLLVCDRSVLDERITNKCVGSECLTETKIQKTCEANPMGKKGSFIFTVGVNFTILSLPISFYIRLSKSF